MNVEQKEFSADELIQLETVKLWYLYVLVVSVRNSHTFLLFVRPNYSKFLPLRPFNIKTGVLFKTTLIWSRYKDPARD